MEICPETLSDEKLPSNEFTLCVKSVVVVSVSVDIYDATRLDVYREFVMVEPRITALLPTVKGPSDDMPDWPIRAYGTSSVDVK